MFRKVKRVESKKKSPSQKRNNKKTRSDDGFVGKECGLQGSWGVSWLGHRGGAWRDSNWNFKSSQKGDDSLSKMGYFLPSCSPRWDSKGELETKKEGATGPRGGDSEEKGWQESLETARQVPPNILTIIHQYKLL